MTIIYKHTCIITNKSYIGKTSRSMEQRLEEHLYFANYKNSKTHFHNALRKYGIDNFISEILEICEESEWREKEIFWIKYFDTANNGYNMTLGGDGWSEWSENRKEEFSKYISGENNPMYGKKGELCPSFGLKRSDETKERMSKSRKKFHQDNPEANANTNNPMHGKNHSNKTKMKMKNKWKEREELICPYCNIKSNNKGNMNRWHFDNCKGKIFLKE